MLPSLNNPKLKVNRAKEQLDVLNNKLRAFMDSNPCRVSEHVDTQKLTYILRCQIPIIAPELAIIAGDAV